jgi:arsenite methyltransferase
MDYLRRQVDLTDPRIASVCDEVSFWSARFGRLLYDNVPLVSGGRVLDLGCANGFPLFELAHTMGERSFFVGVDVWAGALRRAAGKLEVYDLPHVTLVRGDGAAMPLCDASFDLIVSNVGVNNFADPQACLRECHRVLRAGGRLVLTTNVVGHMQELYDLFGDLLSAEGREAERHRLDAQQAHRSTVEELLDALEHAGLTIEQTVEDDFLLRYADGSALLRHSLTWLGFLEGWKSVLEPDRVESTFASLEARLNALANERGELRMRVPMLYVQARREA